jgi:uncharacterized protein YcfJ
MLKAVTLTATALTGLAAVPAMAHERGYNGDDSYRSHRVYRVGSDYRNRDYRDYRRYDRRYDHRSRGYYHNAGCDRGTGGTIIGAIAGGLAGHEIAGGGDRTMGTIIGAGIGAVAGRAIDRSDRRC